MQKDKYVSAIIPLLKEEGLDLSMDVIAQRIGVTKKTLYNRFESKNRLIEDCLAHIAEQFRESLRCMDDESICVEARFVAGINTLRQYFKDMSHAFMRDLLNHYPQQALQDHSSGSIYFEEKIAENIKAGKKEGVYRSDIDEGLFAKYISFSIFSFFQKEVMMANTYSADFYFEQVINFNVNALLIKLK